MVSVKLSDREVEDLSVAISWAVDDLDQMTKVAKSKPDKLAHEATAQRLTATLFKIKKAAQKAAK